MDHTKTAMKDDTQGMSNIPEKNYELNNLLNNMLQNRYKIKFILADGSHSKVFKCIDTVNDTQKQLVVKFIDNWDLYNDHVTAMQHIWKKSSETYGEQEIGIPKVIATGNINTGQYDDTNGKNGHTETQNVSEIKPKFNTKSYIIMPMYGQTLHDYLNQIRHKLSTESVCCLGTKILHILEQIHSAGYVYNDLKPENILFDPSDKLPQKHVKGNCFQNASIKLIDFGCATQYLDLPSLKLKKKKKVNQFRGNLVFSSSNLMQFHSTGRRDDLISLCYLLVYLLIGNKMPTLQNTVDINDFQDAFIPTLNSKLELTEEELCSGRAKIFKNFVKQVFKMRFVDQPDYEALREQLRTLSQQQHQGSTGSDCYEMKESTSDEKMKLAMAYEEESTQTE